MTLNNEQNLAFMNDPRRVAAQKQLDKAVQHIQSGVKFDGNAMYYLTVLPPLINDLSAAYEKLSVVEATIMVEIAGQIK